MRNSMMYDEKTYDKVVLKIFEAIDTISVDTIDEKIILTELQMNLYKFLSDYKEYEENKQVLNANLKRR